MKFPPTKSAESRQNLLGEISCETPVTNIDNWYFTWNFPPAFPPLPQVETLHSVSQLLGEIECEIPDHNKFMLVWNKNILIQFVHICQNTWHEQLSIFNQELPHNIYMIQSINKFFWLDLPLEPWRKAIEKGILRKSSRYYYAGLISFLAFQGTKCLLQHSRGKNGCIQIAAARSTFRSTKLCSNRSTFDEQ